MYHNLAAAYRAQDFFESPSPKTYTELKKAAEKAKVWPPVRERVLRYLETGKRPDAESHPLTALDIWRFIVDGLIAQVKPKAYEEAAGYLRRMYKVYQATRRLPDWQNLLLELRKEHKAKRRLMEVLDGLSGKKITD